MTDRVRPTAAAAPALDAADTLTAPAAIDPAQTLDLLERVVYEQVIGCIDLDELFHLEQSLTLTTGELPGITRDRAGDIARSLLDRAFRRLPDDICNYLRAVEALTCAGCELCDEDARDARDSREPRSRRGAGVLADARRVIRLRS